MTSFIHHKFYTTYRTGLKTVATKLFRRTLTASTYKTSYCAKPSQKNSPGLIWSYVKLNIQRKITHLPPEIPRKFDLIKQEIVRYDEKRNCRKWKWSEGDTITWPFTSRHMTLLPSTLLSLSSLNLLIRKFWTCKLGFVSMFNFFLCKTQFNIFIETGRHKFILIMITMTNKTLCERAIRRCGCGINCECGGIVRNDIFPDSLRINTLTFLLWVTRRLNFFIGSLLGAWPRFDYNFCHK